MYPQTCTQLPRRTYQNKTKQSRQGLRLEQQIQQQDVPRTTRHTFAADPTLWNQLAEHIKKIEDYSTFQSI